MKQLNWPLHPSLNWGTIPVAASLVAQQLWPVKESHHDLICHFPSWSPHLFCLPPQHHLIAGTKHAADMDSSSPASHGPIPPIYDSLDLKHLHWSLVPPLQKDCTGSSSSLMLWSTHHSWTWSSLLLKKPQGCVGWLCKRNSNLVWNVSDLYFSGKSLEPKFTVANCQLVEAHSLERLIFKFLTQRQQQDIRVLDLLLRRTNMTFWFACYMLCGSMLLSWMWVGPSSGASYAWLHQQQARAGAMLLTKHSTAMASWMCARPIKWRTKRMVD